jgi:hypothetical protein
MGRAVICQHREYLWVNDNELNFGCVLRRDVLLAIDFVVLELKRYVDLAKSTDLK